MILDNTLRLFVAQSISFYQQHLSPRKGFRCAYGVLHDGESCSQVIKQRVLVGGVRGLWKDARLQFAQCREACDFLRACNATSSIKGKRHCWKRRKSRDDSWFDRHCNSCDVAQCACNVPDIVSCCTRSGLSAGKSAPCDASPCDGDVCGIDICGCPFN